tara:strand:+ start:244 stop:906 length:663 start_codon:yes stop_codon:yes gene_type:complete
MGYLNNSTITVDAILTKKGREILASGQANFNIAQFALADDEVDYDLYNPDHPLGSAYYGAAIENMPVVEALPDETQMLKYKLVTLSKGSSQIPVVSVGNLNNTGIQINYGESFTIEPQTINMQAGNTTFGYTAILSDSGVCNISATGGSAGTTVPRFVGDASAARSVTVSGTSFTVTGKRHTASNKQATILFVGNETGGRVVVPIIVNRDVLPTVGYSVA